MVKSLAGQGITVCATIHSPTPYTFGLFDRLLLLLSGQMVYFGPNGEWQQWGYPTQGTLSAMPSCRLAADLPFLLSKEAPVLPVLPAQSPACLCLHLCPPSCLLAGKHAVDYFHTKCPTVPRLKEGEAEAEWIVDLTTLADRRGLASEFAATYATSELKAAVNKEIERQFSLAIDLGEQAVASLCA